ncbi:sigma-54-dependent Fis family transcriptional regulator [Desulfosporosinus sp.]|uniref:sigma-54-dependent Fis family transcriptional regulator n=1 Tax=Desulfosporosinus sp. TaxID=157907 RepID=UPI0025B7C95E|nr:sigma-54-dependent Fis family transcriptional regulator [Desulfosporosinus sp.]MBC2729077.1 sigma-54-dependent Fis family transcriptional regulator [Desulfosporosinus sp.]
MSSNLAIFSSEGLFKHRRLLEETRYRFLNNSHDQINIRSIVYDSWVRCLQSGIDPRRKQTEEPLKTADIRNIIESSKLHEASTDTLNDLVTQAQETNYIITLCDSQGRIIFLSGNRQVKRQAERINFVLGSRWSEAAIGTNAIGTSIETGYPVQIFAAEHFCEGIHDWVCSSSPVRDPVTKEVLGVIDVTGFWKEAQTHTLGMAVMASRVIEQRLYMQAISTRLQLIERYFSVVHRYPKEAVIVLDSAFEPIKTNELAHKFVNQVTGKDIENLWGDHEFKAFIKHHLNNVQQNKNYEVFIEQFGISASIQEIYDVGKRLGFVLILKLSDQQTPAKYLANTPWSKIVGKSSNILSAITQCNMVAHTNVPVLLFGESGSGKELFARAIHQTSDRRKGPFVAINCGAVPKELLASELFGYDPGTFTGAAKAGRKGKFEEAHQGTLFLDEIGEMPLGFQVHLLRVLQEREVVRLGGTMPIPVDVKIIAATHHNLEELVNNGSFRADCFYRLHVVSITIPPLRERREDIPLLIDHYLEQFALKYDKPLPKFDQQIKNYLVNTYRWPGNVRELQNCLEHAVLFCLNGTIIQEDLPQSIQRNVQNNSSWITDKIFDASQRKSSTHEKEALIRLIQESGGNLSEAARQLGVARTTLYRQLDKYGVTKTW